MIVDAVLALIVVIGVIVEVLFPGESRYHNGWYIVGLAALVIILALRLRAAFASVKTNLGRAGLIVASFGVGAVAVAGIGFGLFAADPQVVVGAPGATQTVDGVDLTFPLATNAPVRRQLRDSMLLVPEPRTVIGVDVGDARGHRVTITQPTGVAFLSPILLMQSTQKIAGMIVPYDSFAVPAAHRVVKAVFLASRALVLFDVEDQNETQIPNGIGVASDGQTIRVAGLTIRPHVLSYPAIRVLPLPNPWITGLGTLAALVGILLVLLDRRVRPALA